MKMVNCWKPKKWWLNKNVLHTTKGASKTRLLACLGTNSLFRYLVTWSKNGVQILARHTPSLFILFVYSSLKIKIMKKTVILLSALLSSLVFFSASLFAQEQEDIISLFKGSEIIFADEIGFE